MGKKYISTEVLNERLRFAGKTREELAMAMGCTEESLRACMTKENRPVYEKLNRQADILSAAFVRARRDELAEEIKANFPKLAEKNIIVLRPDLPSVVVVADGKLAGIYNPETGGMF